MRKRETNKERVVKGMTRIASMLRAMNRSEVSFEEFVGMSREKREFLKDLKRYGLRIHDDMVKFMDGDGEVMIFADLKSQKFIVKWLR